LQLAGFEQETAIAANFREVIWKSLKTFGAKSIQRPQGRQSSPPDGRVPCTAHSGESAMNLTPRPVLLSLLLLLNFPARAQGVEVGTSLICDTQAQVERYISLYDGDAESTVNSVNAAEHDPTACAVAPMAYVRGRQLAKARNKDTTFQIVPILVLGVVTEAGVKTLPPAPYFSVIVVEEIGV
jgi:hypothetical protein